MSEIDFAFAQNYCNFSFYPVTDAFYNLTVVFIAPSNLLNISKVLLCCCFF